MSMYPEEYHVGRNRVSTDKGVSDLYKKGGVTMDRGVDKSSFVETHDFHFHLYTVDKYPVAVLATHRKSGKPFKLFTFDARYDYVRKEVIHVIKAEYPGTTTINTNSFFTLTGMKIFLSDVYRVAM